MTSFSLFDLEPLVFRDENLPARPYDFQRGQQALMCARQLVSLKEFLGDRWFDLAGTPYRSAGMKEAKKLASSLIRIASESIDHLATVDFVSQGALNILVKLRSEHAKNKSLYGHLKARVLSHEHMVPCDFVLKHLTTRRTQQSIESFAEILSAMSYRALIVKQLDTTITNGSEADLKILDKNYRKHLPCPSETSLSAVGHRSIYTLPIKYFALLRYDKTGLLSQMVPISQRANELLQSWHLEVSKSARKTSLI